jgi:hypothetical protein
MRDREHVPGRRVEDESLLEFDGTDDRAFGTEPARAGDRFAVETGERRRDRGPSRWNRQTPVLIITCLMNV